MFNTSELKKLFRLIENHGFLSALRIYFKIKYNKKGTIQLPGIKHPLFFRPGTVDKYTIYEIFAYRDYDIELEFDPKFIIDAGANIGLTSVFFANKYPHAKIIAIEPEENNFTWLKKNTQPYHNIEIRKSALWKKNAFIEVKDNGYGFRGFVVEESAEQTAKSFRGTSVIELMPENKIIDILKMDIEGSEKFIFEDNYAAWLPNVRCLIVELHDRTMKGCSKSVFNALRNYNFSCSIKGDNLVFINEDPPSLNHIPDVQYSSSDSILQY